MQKQKGEIILFIISLVIILYFYHTQTAKPQPIQDIKIYGNVKPLNKTTEEFLLSVVRKLDLQARCMFDEERVQAIRAKDDAIEFIFKTQQNIRISQWIKPEDRSLIKTDENGYRVLENVKRIVFVLSGELKENVLIGNKNSMYSCWRASNYDWTKNISVSKKFCGWSTYGSCSSDSDCIKGGCSGEVCQSNQEQPLITTCEWKNCYNPDRYGLYCKCVNEKCQWSS